MSTLTPNYGLHLPENTDSVDDFFTNYESDMTTIDDHLGSGGGGGNVYGAFIDTNRVIASGIYSSSNPLVYTATEDCFADIAFLSADGDKNVYAWIDGVQVDRLFNNAGIVVSNEIYPLRKGQTLRVETSRVDPDSAYTIYGVTQGTNGIFTPIIYSDTERVVGVWRDNKPLYQKTISVAPLPNSGTKEIQLDNDIEKIISMNGYAIDGNDKWDIFFNDVVPTNNNASIRVYTNTTTKKLYITTAVDLRSYTEAYITVQYTKTTDVAGSGNWNTDGVPTVHYSTNEQVIGTWTDGKPLYQQTVIFDTGNVASNIDFNISSYMPVNSVVRHTSFTLDFTFNGDTYHGANWGGAYVEISGVSYLSFNIGSATYNKHVELTLQYTKTTD